MVDVLAQVSATPAGTTGVAGVAGAAGAAVATALSSGTAIPFTAQGAGAAAVPAAAAVIHVLSIIEGDPELLFPDKHAALLAVARSVWGLVDQTIAVVVDSVCVATLVGPGVDVPIVIVAIAVVGAGTVSVTVITAVLVSNAVLGCTIAADIWRAEVGQGVIVVAVVPFPSLRHHAVAVVVVNRAGQVTVAAIFIDAIAADFLASRIHAGVAVVAIFGKWYPVLVQIVGQAPLVNLSVAVVVYLVPAARRPGDVTGVSPDSLQHPWMYPGVLVVAVRAAPVADLLEIPVPVVIARLVPVVTALGINGTIFIYAVATDFLCPGVDQRVIVIAIVPRKAVSVAVRTGTVAVETVFVVTIATGVGGEGIPRVGRPHRAALVTGFVLPIVSRGVAVFHSPIGRSQTGNLTGACSAGERTEGRGILGKGVSVDVELSRQTSQVDVLDTGYFDEAQADRGDAGL
jgi:hypothetical protein